MQLFQGGMEEELTKHRRMKWRDSRPAKFHISWKCNSYLFNELFLQHRCEGSSHLVHDGHAIGEVNLPNKQSFIKQLTNANLVAQYTSSTSLSHVSNGLPALQAGLRGERAPSRNYWSYSSLERLSRYQTYEVDSSMAADQGLWRHSHPRLSGTNTTTIYCLWWCAPGVVEEEKRPVHKAWPSALPIVSGRSGRNVARWMPAKPTNHN